MANNLQILRALALCQCTAGFLMLIFGMVDRAVVHFWTSHVGFPIWIGAWITATGVIGCFASSRRRSTLNVPMVGVYLGFSITATVLAGIIIICYSIVLSIKSEEWRSRNRIDFEVVDFEDGGTYLYGRSGYDTCMAISSIVLILGLVQFFLGIWSAICCCQAFGCQCCAVEQQAQAGQVMYVTNQGVPVTTQVLPQNSGDLRMHSGPISAVPTSGGTMMAVPVQVSNLGQQVVAVHMPHVGSPMMAMQVPTPVSAAPVVAVPVGTRQLQGQVIAQQPGATAATSYTGVVDASLTVGQHVNV